MQKDFAVHSFTEYSICCNYCQAGIKRMTFVKENKIF